METPNYRKGSIYFDDETVLEVEQRGGGGSGVGGELGLKARNLVTGEETGEGSGVTLKACGISTSDTDPIIISHPIDPETGSPNLNAIAPVSLRNSVVEYPLIGKAREDGKVVYYITYNGGFIPSNITVRPEDGYTYEIAGNDIIVVGPGYDLGEDTYPLGVTISGEVN